MAYTARELIIDAYYYSNIVARGLETVTGQEISDGLKSLNSELSLKSLDNGLIPYFKEYTFDGIVDPPTEMYFIPNLILADTVTFNYNTSVRFPMQPESRIQYFGTARVNGIQSLPYQYRTERCVGGCNLFIYFLPEQEFPFTIYGKFGFTSVELTTDISEVYDEWYLEYLRFALARRLVFKRPGSQMPDNIKAELERIEASIKNMNKPDLSIVRRSALGGTPGLNWGLVNIPGWVP